MYIHKFLQLIYISVLRGATGIGLQTVLALLNHSAKVYIASRSQSKFDAVVATLEEGQKQRLKFLLLDLSSLKACVDAAESFGRMEKRCDVLIANAALSIMVRLAIGRMKPHGREDNKLTLIALCFDG